jgi:hypothetical protein
MHELMLCTAKSRRPGLLNGLLMSVSFAGLESCVIATINLSAALLSPELANDINAILFSCFALGTFGAPAVVRMVGMKNAMIASVHAVDARTTAAACH